MYYVSEIDKLNKIDKIFKRLHMEDNFIFIPENEENILSDKKEIILANKVVKILKNTYCKKVILSKFIKRNNNYINCLYQNGIDVVEGKWIYKVLVIDIIEYLFKKEIMDKLNISILINDINLIDYQIIKLLIQKYKKINIISNHKEKFKNLINEMYVENGIVVTLNSNRKKALMRNNFIINFDFTNEIINKFNINDTAIILNLDNDINIESKRFNGIIIRNCIIKFNGNSEDEKFDNKEIYESQFEKKSDFLLVQKQLRKDNVRIEKLCCKHGEI